MWHVVYWFGINWYWCKGVALQYILYSDLRPRSRWKSKVKVGFLVGQKSSIDFLVYTTIDTFRDSCVNIILQKFTRDWTRVKHDFQRSRLILAWPSTLTEDKDRSTAKIWVPPPYWWYQAPRVQHIKGKWSFIQASCLSFPSENNHVWKICVAKNLIGNI